MPSAVARASGDEITTVTMAELIGMIVTQFPYAHAAASLGCSAARERFARLALSLRGVSPRTMRNASKRYAARQRAR